MSTIGTPFTSTAIKVLLCGSGELGKEVALELQRYGVEVIAVDAYADAPAMQVADRSHVISMLDDDAFLDAFTTRGEPDEIAGMLREKYGAHADRLAIYAPYAAPDAMWKKIITGLKP